MNDIFTFINPFSFYFSSFFSSHLCIYILSILFALFLFFIIILLYFLHIVLLYPYIYSSRNIRRTKCILLLYCKTPKLCYWRRYINSYKVLIWFDLSRMPFCHVCHVCVIHIYRLLKGYRTYFKFWSRGGLFFNRTQERIYCNILFTEKYEIWEVHVFKNIYCRKWPRKWWKLWAIQLSKC